LPTDDQRKLSFKPLEHRRALRDPTHAGRWTLRTQRAIDCGGRREQLLTARVQCVYSKAPPAMTLLVFFCFFFFLWGGQGRPETVDGNPAEVRPSTAGYGATRARDGHAGMMLPGTLHGLLNRPERLVSPKGKNGIFQITEFQLRVSPPSWGAFASQHSGTAARSTARPPAIEPLGRAAGRIGRATDENSCRPGADKGRGDRGKSGGSMGRGHLRAWGPFREGIRRDRGHVIQVQKLGPPWSSTNVQGAGCARLLAACS